MGGFTSDGFLILVSSLIFASGTYIVWPSRWNLPAHIGLGFWSVSVLVPVAFVGVQNAFPPEIVHEYANVMALGALAFVPGLLIGSALVPRSARPAFFDRIAVKTFDPSARSTRRTEIVALGAILMMVFALARMGFIPMFADDPFAAKFFRGRYGEAYQSVAVFYRAATGLLSLLMPVLAAYAFYAVRSTRWRLLLLMSFVLMLVTLQRGPAATGLLLFVGVVLVQRGRWVVFVIATIGVYVGGALFYAVLSALGVLGAEYGYNSVSLIQTVASTAPDVSDALQFLVRWHYGGEPLTMGRTFLGGMVPGNFSWNPGVWTLTLGDSFINLSAINSGGLRLPNAIWGRVSLGPMGVMLIPFVSGVVAGVLARSVRNALPLATNRMALTWTLVVYVALSALLVDFTTIGYLGVLQVAAALWIVRGSESRVHARPTNQSKMTHPGSDSTRQENS